MKLPSLIWFAGLATAMGQDPTPEQGATPEPQLPLIEAAASLPGPRPVIKKGIVTKDEHGVVVLDLPDSSPSDRIQYTLRDGDAILDNPPEKGIPLYLDVERIPRRGRQYIALKDFTARSVGQWMGRAGDHYSNSKVPSKKALYEKAVSLRTKINENLTVPADNQDWIGLADQYREMRGLIGEAYMDESDNSLRDALTVLRYNLTEEGNVFLSNKLSDEATSEKAAEYRDNLPDVEKGFYRMNDNFRPEIYPKIAERSKASVAIVRKGQAVPLGSGALIGPNLVLTCRHNIEVNYAREGSSRYEVWLDREEQTPARVDPPRKYPAHEIPHTTRPGAKNLDFCLLEIDVPGGKVEGVEPLRVNTADIDRDTSIFVVGYPQGGYRTVHDSSWVLFPHKILSKAVRGEITLEVRREFLLNEPNRSSDSAIRNATDKADDFMEWVYGEPKDDPNAVYRLSKEGEEYLGIDSDTFEGDSGAPVMLREGGSLIGLLYKGPADGGVSAQSQGRRPVQSLLPGASQHERVLPISLIMEQLDIEDLKTNRKVVFVD